MNGMTYFLETFGCQMNVLDSQLVEGQLRALGLRPVSDHRHADIILFNTCSVRQHAEEKVLSRLGGLKAHKRRRPETIIGVLGCMAEREKKDLFTKAPHVDLLCGPGELNRLPALLAEVRQRHEQVAALAGSQSRRTGVLQRALEYDSLEALDLSRSLAGGENPPQAYVRVQRGCDQFCTYCVVPFTRGPERSRPPSHIVEEVQRLAEHGCREVTLLGQTVNSYVYQEDGPPVSFARLLEHVHAVPGIDRIRFVTSFPAGWDEDIFRVMRDCPRLMPYLHIPAQSGSDRILAAMRRGYTVAEYLKLLDTARKYIPDISLAGDFIVGFCGETEEDFQASVDLVRRVEYKSIFVFKYSPRPGTVADRRLADDVTDEVKVRRNNELLAVQERISLRQKQALIGRTVEVLVEGCSKAARKLAARLGTARPRAANTTLLPSREGLREGRNPRSSPLTLPSPPSAATICRSSATRSSPLTPPSPPRERGVLTGVLGGAGGSLAGVAVPGGVSLPVVSVRGHSVRPALQQPDASAAANVAAGLRTGRWPVDARQQSEHDRGHEAWRSAVDRSPAGPADGALGEVRPPVDGTHGPTPEPGVPARELHRQLVGRTPGDLIVVFDGAPEHIGALVNVRVEGVSPLTLFGRIDAVVSPARGNAR